MKAKSKQKVKDQYKYAIASIIFGIVSLFAWFFPAIGFPTSVAGLGLGFEGRKSSMERVAKVGMILSIIGLVLSLANIAWGIYLGYTGELAILK